MPGNPKADEPPWRWMLAWVLLTYFPVPQLSHLIHMPESWAGSIWVSIVPLGAAVTIFAFRRGKKKLGLWTGLVVAAVVFYSPAPDWLGIPAGWVRPICFSVSTLILAAALFAAWRQWRQVRGTERLFQNQKGPAL